ncbi:MAG: hypothetical protein ACI9OH_002817 [Oleispira sp.]|jgi:hypothetical protein
MVLVLVFFNIVYFNGARQGGGNIYMKKALMMGSAASD